MIDLQPFADAFPSGNIRHHFIGGVYAKELLIPAGFRLVSHRHKYDHLSILASGAVWLTIDDKTRLATGPCALNIPAGKEHMVQAETDAVWFCIHPTDETDYAKVDETLIEGGT